MISKWQWLLAQLTRTLWIRATLYVVLALAAALLAVLIERLLPGPLPIDIGADAVDRILDILASSMLAVTTFSLSVMVAAYSTDGDHQCDAPRHPPADAGHHHAERAGYLYRCLSVQPGGPGGAEHRDLW
jgi:hypothetical protein